MQYEAVVGLEVHAQLLTESKIFCGCPTRFGAPPNTNVCPVCLGLPGSLPVLNRKAVELATRAALALNCRINERSVFARKNYFYPDLPKGYQISQYDQPLALEGWLEFEDGEGACRVSVQRVHLEEDAGKSLHQGFPDSGVSTYVDFNRSGVPLIEIVTGPDLRSPREAWRFLQEIKTVLEFLEVSDCNMEEGSLRCDANVSVRPAGTQALGTRTELKNMNSFRAVRRALEFEIARQTGLLRAGGKVLHETLLWDESGQRTLPMRGKEEAFDYRYFPEPDLLPVHVPPGWQEGIRGKLPELPAQMRDRFETAYGLPRYDVGVLTRSRSLASYFEATAAASGNPKAASNWIATEVLRELKGEEDGLDSFPVRPARLAELIRLVESGRVSGRIAKDVFQKMISTGRDPRSIVEEEDLEQISGREVLDPLVREVVERNAKAVEEYRAGNVKVKGFLVGKVMERTRGRADPGQVNELLGAYLEGAPAGGRADA